MAGHGDPRARSPLRAPLAVGALLLGLGLGLFVRQAGPRGLISLAAPGPSPTGDAAYDPSSAPVLSKTLFYVRENHIQAAHLDLRRMVLNALAFVQRDVPEVVVSERPGAPDTIEVQVADRSQAFDLGAMTGVWDVRDRLRGVLGFVSSSLPPTRRGAGQRQLEIERSATNGLLKALDPYSRLDDAASYGALRVGGRRTAGVGLSLRRGRSGRLVVDRILPNTPAIRVGLQKGDHVVQVGGKATEGLELDVVVGLLVGDAGTNVTVEIERGLPPKRRRFTVTREPIRASAVDPPPLLLTTPARDGRPPGKVGYLRLRHFGADTDADVREALDSFARQKARGIVLDLRGNQGGLLEQGRRVADEFIAAGVIASTVGERTRQDMNAVRGREPSVPVAVLVDHECAGATEIVAGALKGLDRAVVLGEPTFGRGSVQVLFDVPSPLKQEGDGPGDPLGLRLTVSKFLVAGDTSIDGTGVVPDLLILEQLLPKNGDGALVRLRPGASPDDSSTIRYVSIAPDQDEGLEREPEQDGAVVFARDLVSQAETPSRRALLAATKELVEHWRAAEDQKLVDALAPLGVDWRTDTTRDPGVASVAVAVDAPGGRAAGGPLVLRVTARNTGARPAHRVDVVLASSNAAIDGRELVFGRLAPGEARSREVRAPLGGDPRARDDVVTARASWQGGVAVSSDLVVSVEGAPRPRFELACRTESAGETTPEGARATRLVVTLRNAGAGPARDARIAASVPAGQAGLTLGDERRAVGALAPGQSRDVTFPYTLAAPASGAEPTIDLTVSDGDAGDSVVQPVQLGLGGASPPGRLAAPIIEVTAPTRVAAESIRVRGRVTDEARVRDVWIAVSRVDARTPTARGDARPAWRKVYYRQNDALGDATAVDVDAQVPLEPGSNTIRVYARDGDEGRSVTTLVVLRTR